MHYWLMLFVRHTVRANINTILEKTYFLEYKLIAFLTKKAITLELMQEIVGSGSHHKGSLAYDHMKPL